MDTDNIKETLTEGMDRTHVIGVIPQIPEDILQKRFDGQLHWHIRHKFNELNTELLSEHYNFLINTDDFSKEFSMFKGFFNAYYRVQFLQAEIFLKEIREKYPTVSMNKAIISMMEGKQNQLMTILKRKLPRYTYFFEAVSKGELNYYNSKNILFDKPVDAIDFTHAFGRLGPQQMIDYWDFLQNLIEPIENPETMVLTRTMALGIADTLSRNTAQHEGLLEVLSEVIGYCKEHFIEIQKVGKPIQIKRFHKNLELSASQFKNTVLKCINATWIRDDIKDELIRIFGEWDRTFGSKLTDERFLGLFFGSLGYKNQDYAEKSIRTFFKTQKYFYHIFNNLDDKYKEEAIVSLAS